MRGSRVVVRIVVGAATLLLSLVGIALVAGSTAAAQGGVHVALGDSYTSAPLVPMQHGDPIDCGRSDHNYPSLVAETLKPDTFIDVSCGSAKTKHMTEPQTDLPAGGTNPPQFDALRADATLVTVGIGGNDAGLVGVAEECAQLGLTQPFGTACRDRYAPNGNDTVDAKIEATRPRIDGVLQGIHQRSPNARVAIVGYPNVLPIDGTNCYPMVPLSVDDVRYIDGLIRRINAMISQEAAKNDAEFIDTYDDSIGHDVCKLPPERWFEGLVPTEPAFPLHPNGRGEASMARSAIKVLNKPAARPDRVHVKGLKVKPKRVRKGKVTVRFRLDGLAMVDLSRLRANGKGSGRVIVEDVPGHEGRNEVKVPARKLGKRSGRYRLKATATSAAGTNGARARYRVRNGKGTK